MGVRGKIGGQLMWLAWRIQTPDVRAYISTMFCLGIGVMDRMPETEDGGEIVITVSKRDNT